jgi:hypothetical protein
LEMLPLQAFFQMFLNQILLDIDIFISCHTQYKLNDNCLFLEPQLPLLIFIVVIDWRTAIKPRCSPNPTQPVLLGILNARREFKAEEMI